MDNYVWQYMSRPLCTLGASPARSFRVTCYPASKQDRDRPVFVTDSMRLACQRRQCLVLDTPARVIQTEAGEVIKAVPLRLTIVRIVVPTCHSVILICATPAGNDCR